MSPDDQLEAEIDLTFCALLAAENAQGQRAAFNQMRELIAARSPEQIQRMERERGLRA